MPPTRNLGSARAPARCRTPGPGGSRRRRLVGKLLNTQAPTSCFASAHGLGLDAAAEGTLLAFGWGVTGLFRVAGRRVPLAFHGSMIASTHRADRSPSYPGSIVSSTFGAPRVAGAHQRRRPAVALVLHQRPAAWRGEVSRDGGARGAGRGDTGRITRAHDGGHGLLAVPPTPARPACCPSKLPGSSTEIRRTRPLGRGGMRDSAARAADFGWVLGAVRQATCAFSGAASPARMESGVLWHDPLLRPVHWCPAVPGWTR